MSRITSRMTTHPGAILREEFMKPYRMTAYRLAKNIGVPRGRIEKLSREERGISADTAWRLSKLFGTSPEFWMNLQTAHELSNVAQTVSVEKIINAHKD